MSQADPGRIERMSVGARLITDVCAIADRPFVEAVENSFAGYFDELGITVKFRAEASDADVEHALLDREVTAVLHIPRRFEEDLVRLRVAPVQLVLNAAWSPIFFSWHGTKTALVTIVALLLAIGMTISFAS